MADATVRIRGRGIHSGVRSEVRLHRAAGGVRFRRGRTEIPATIDRVVATSRCTVLGAGAARVAVVEHLLAALHAAGFWRELLIEVDADELPILDGSAAPWAELLPLLGPPPDPPAPLRPDRPLRLEEGRSQASCLPGATSLCVEIDFAHPAIGRQRWCGAPNHFQDVLPARTFGFLAEMEALRAQGLATAAGTENAIVFDGAGPLGTLRFADEPVRHKALDALGDLFLLGRPVAGTITVRRGSHRLHAALVRALASTEGSSGRNSCQNA